MAGKMKVTIDVTQVMKNYDGATLKVPDQNKPGERRDGTVRDYLSLALNLSDKDEVMTAEQKSKSSYLIVKIWKKKEVEFTADDALYIKGRAEKILDPWLYGEMLRLLELLEDK